MNINNSPNRLRSQDILFGAMKIAGLAMTMFGISFFAGSVSSGTGKIFDKVCDTLDKLGVQTEVLVGKQGVWVTKNGRQFFINPNSRVPIDAQIGETLKELQKK